MRWLRRLIPGHANGGQIPPEQPRPGETRHTLHTSSACIPLATLERYGATELYQRYGVGQLYAVGHDGTLYEIPEDWDQRQQP